MKIYIVKASDGYFLSMKADVIFIKLDKNYRFNSSLFCESTWLQDWYKLPEKPNKVEHLIPKKITKRYLKLQDEYRKITELDLPYIIEEDSKYCYYDYEWIFKTGFEHFQPFYKEELEFKHEFFEEIKFELIDFGEIKGSIESGNIHFDSLDNNIFLEKNIRVNSYEHQLIDKMIFPSPILSERPTKLSSKEFYNIIRRHVRDNIDSRYAEITSDYNFCFAVKKKINLCTPYEETFTPQTFSGKKSKKSSKRMIKSRYIEIFEMTWSPENYKEYTPIEAVIADSHQKLKIKVDKYLDELMKKINEPLIDCPHCNGKGVVFEIDKGE